MLGLLAIAVFVGALVVAVQRRAGWILSLAYGLVGLIAAGAAVWLTFFYDYWANPDTHIHGWPAAIAIFHRDSPTAPFLDYVVPGLLGVSFVYAVNLSLLMFLPSIGLLAISWWRPFRESPTNSDPSDGPKSVTET
jgi:hypothetical protein